MKEITLVSLIAIVAIAGMVFLSLQESPTIKPFIAKPPHAIEGPPNTVGYDMYMHNPPGSNDRNRPRD